MKHMNIKIALLAFTLLLAIGQSKANESGLSLTNRSVGKSSNLVEIADFERGEAGKLFLSPELTDSPFLIVKRCEISPGVNGTFCKTTEQCVASRKECPKKQKSPHRRYKDTALDNGGI